MANEAETEAGARALCALWGDHWECVCSERKGVDCDCGDAISEERVDGYDERMSREDYRHAAQVVLESREQ